MRRLFIRELALASVLVLLSGCATAGLNWAASDKATFELDVVSLRSKHIDIMHHFARERVVRKEVAFTYVQTTEMVADVLTKALPKAKHQMCKAWMGMV